MPASAMWDKVKAIHDGKVVLLHAPAGAWLLEPDDAQGLALALMDARAQLLGLMPYERLKPPEPRKPFSLNEAAREVNAEARARRETLPKAERPDEQLGEHRADDGGEHREKKGAHVCGPWCGSEPW